MERKRHPGADLAVLTPDYAALHPGYTSGRRAIALDSQSIWSAQGHSAAETTMNPYLAQIEIFAFNFAPQGWAPCNGQVLSIAQNQALFSLIGVTYGGNGFSDFNLPKLSALGPQGPHYFIYIDAQAATYPPRGGMGAEPPAETETA
jgi:hypothetical protein